MNLEGLLDGFDEVKRLRRSTYINTLEVRDTASDEHFVLKDIQPDGVTLPHGSHDSSSDTIIFVSQANPGAIPDRSASQERAIAKEKTLDHVYRQWELSEAGGKRFIAPIERVGETETSAFYLRKHYPISLFNDVIKIKVKDSQLFHITNAIWETLAFIHQQPLNHPHGNLKLSNVLLDQTSIEEANCFLTDPVLCEENEIGDKKRADFKSLATIIYQLATNKRDPVEAFDLESRLGGNRNPLEHLEHADVWKNTCLLLLDNQRSPQEIRGARQDCLQKIAPSHFAWSPVPLPLTVHRPETSPQPTEDDSIDPFAAALGEGVRLRDSGDWAGAVQHFTSLFEDYKSHESEIVNEIEISLNAPPRDIETNPSYLAVLENLDSAHALPRAGYYARLNTASSAKIGGDYSTALETLCAIFSEFPDDERTLKRIGETVSAIPVTHTIDEDLILALEESANSGNSIAMMRFGIALASEDATADDIDRAEKWLRKASASGSPEAVIELGKIHEYKTQNLDLAEQIYSEAVDQSAAIDAPYRLAVVLLKQDNEQSLARAIDLLEQQRQLGDSSAGDLLAQCYAKGKGVATDPARAFGLFQEAWQTSESNGTPNYIALHNMGVCHLKAKGTKRDQSAAFECFSRGADKGLHPPCMRSLATCYRNGYGVNPDATAAEHWLQQSATAPS